MPSLLSPPAATHLVVICREGRTGATEFANFDDAADYYDMAGANWTDSFLCVVVAGPGMPLRRGVDPHRRPDVVAMRRAALSVCADPDCDLSGGHAHAGLCEPCGCPLRHARAECPHDPEFGRP